jgi:hypothetical protein
MEYRFTAAKLASGCRQMVAAAQLSVWDTVHRVLPSALDRNNGRAGR